MNGSDVAGLFRLDGGPKQRMIAKQARDLALTVAGAMGDCREKSAAVAHIQDAVAIVAYKLGDE